MNLDQFVTNETGKKHLIPGQAEIYRGQCVQLIGIYLKAVYGQDLPAHPNAKDYWTYGIPGWEKVNTPQKGDIAVYDGHAGFPEGHIAIYYDGRVFEENADPDGSPAHLANRTNTHLLGYLRKKGSNIMSPGEVATELNKRDQRMDGIQDTQAKIVVRQDELAKQISGLVDTINTLNINMGKLINPGGRLDTDYQNLLNEIKKVKG